MPEPTGFATFEHDGKTWQIPRMRPVDFIALEAELFSERRTQLIADMDAAGISAGPDRLAQLQKCHEDRGDQYWAVVLDNWKPQAARKLIRRQLSLIADAPDIDSMTISPFALLRLASSICNYDLDAAAVSTADADRKKMIEDGDLPPEPVRPTSEAGAGQSPATG